MSVLLEEREGLPGRLVEGDGGRVDPLEQAGPRVEIADERVHFGEHVVGLVNDEARTFGDDVEVVVAHEGRYLDDGAGLWIESGHLEVDPHHPVGMLAHSSMLADSPLPRNPSCAKESAAPRAPCFRRGSDPNVSVRKRDQPCVTCSSSTCRADAARPRQGRQRRAQRRASRKELLAQTLNRLADKSGIDKNDVEDVVVGVVTQVNEQGARTRKRQRGAGRRLARAT